MSRTALDEILHAANRLEICAFLMPLEEAEFRVIREQLSVSDSVLSKQMSRLQDAGYITLRKNALNGRQRTWASMTKNGRRAFENHVAALQRLIAKAK